MNKNNVDVLLGAMSLPDLKVTKVFHNEEPHPAVVALGNSAGCSFHPWATLCQEHALHPTIALTNARLTVGVLSTLDRCGVHLVIGTRGLRNRPSEWSYSLTEVCHASVGGVTANKSKIVVATKGLAPPDLVIPEATPRDASTVLEFLPCPKHVPMPEETLVDPLRVVPCGPGESAVHGKGLLCP